MEPNNNQPINTNPFGQPVAPQPAAAPFPSSVPPQEPTPTPIQTAPATPAATAVSSPTPKNGGKKIIALLIILLILALGIGGYVLFAKNQLKSAQKISTENNTSVVPTETIEPTVTPATIEGLNVENPDADLKTIESNLQGL